MVGLTQLAGRLAVCRLPPDASLPAWATAGALFCVARSGDELSIVCAAADVPAGVTRQAPFVALRVDGPLDFALTGILAGLSGALAAAGISLFAFSTYDTDYLLVRAERLDEARTALQAAGYGIRDERERER